MNKIDAPTCIHCAPLSRCLCRPRTLYARFSINKYLSGCNGGAVSSLRLTKSHKCTWFHEIALSHLLMLSIGGAKRFSKKAFEMPGIVHKNVKILSSKTEKKIKITHLNWIQQRERFNLCSRRFALFNDIYGNEWYLVLPPLAHCSCHLFTFCLNSSSLLSLYLV